MECGDRERSVAWVAKVVAHTESVCGTEPGSVGRRNAQKKESRWRKHVTPRAIWLVASLS